MDIKIKVYVDGVELEPPERLDHPGPNEIYVGYSRYWYRDRSYDLFAALANVRNRVGPEDRGDPIPPMRTTYDQSLPADGEHSFVKVSLQEVSEYDWEQLVTDRCVISKDSYRAWKGEPYPSTELPFPVVVHPITQTAPGAILEREATAVRVEYQRPLLDTIPNSWFAFLDELWQYVEEAEDIDLVIGFES